MAGEFTREQYAKFGALCAEKAARAERASRLRREREARSGRPLSDSERQHRQVLKLNELAELPPVADPERRERCRLDLAEFCRTYAAKFLDHLPGENMIREIVRPLQESILRTGAMDLFEAPRGIGKTTLIILAIAWALSYGHRKYVVLVSATGKLAVKNLKNALYVMTRSSVYVADFPEVALPILALEGKWQKAATQTYRGKLTDLEWRADHVKLATIAGEDGIEFPASGGIIYSVGVGGAIRGLNDAGVRPDMVFLDDIQKRKDAKSPSLSAELESFVKQDVMGLFSHSNPKTMLMAITPICEGDFASLISDKERNPGWRHHIIPLVKSWPDEALVTEWLELWREDMAVDDGALTRSTAFYRKHRKEFAAAQLLDDRIGAMGEVDAFHHVLLLMAPDHEAFDAEYQMKVREEGEGVQVTAAMVKHNLTGVAEFELPDYCTDLVAFCDVNIQKESGMRYTVLAVGPGRTAAVVHYGKYPRVGRLFPEDTPEANRDALIAAAVVTVGRMLSGQRVTRTDGSAVCEPCLFRTRGGKQLKPYAIWFDGGNWTRAVSRATYLLKSVYHVGPVVAWSLGRNWKQFKDLNHVDKQERGDHLYRATSRNGRHYIIQTDYWREIAQSSFLAPAGTNGSCGLWGDDPVRHDQYALELTAERLVAKFRNPAKEMEWEWVQKSKLNHYLDTLTGAFACASKYGLYEASVRTIDRALLASGPAVASVPGGQPAPVARGVVYRPRAPRFKYSFKLRKQK